MTQLIELYSGDERVRDPQVRRLAATVEIPHPLHGVDYGDGPWLCGRSGCRGCRNYRRGLTIWGRPR